MSAQMYEIYDRLTPPVEEAFKTLRTNITFCGAGSKLKSIAVVSCNPKEGKTSVAINLSISIARTGKRVLFVDADLRKHTLFKRLSGNNVGLSNYLLGEESLDEVIASTSIKNLFYVPCGPKPLNPSELIGSTTFTQFLHTVEGLFDLVIIDTSTLGSVIDGAVVAAQTDGTVIVIATDSVSSNKAKRLKEQLENVNARIIGAVLNKISKRDYKMYNEYYNNFMYYSVPKNSGSFLKSGKKKIKNKKAEYHD